MFQVIIFCNSIKDELVVEVNWFIYIQKSNGFNVKDDKDINGLCVGFIELIFEYLDYVCIYFMF